MMLSGISRTKTSKTFFSLEKILGTAPMDWCIRFGLPSLLFGRFGLACQTTFTAMLASFLGSNSKSGRSGATQPAIEDGGSSSSRINALLRSYRYSVASQPLFFLVVAFACIVPAAEAECPAGQYQPSSGIGRPF